MQKCILLLLVQVLRAQENVGMLQKAVLALLLIEGLMIIVLAVGLVVRMLGSVSMHRQALFSVFLAIPNNFLRTLASKSVSIGEEDGEEEDSGLVSASRSLFQA